MPLDDVDIIVGDEPDELDHLVDLWMDETYQPIGVSISSTRNACERLFNRFFPQLSETRRAQADRKEQFRLDFARHLQEIIDRGDMVVARRNGKVLGMIRVYKLDESDVCEIGKAFVLPEERGRGIFRELRKQAIAHVKEKYGDVPVLMGTKIEGIKRLNREDGWTKISFEEYLRICKAPESYIESRKKDIRENELTAFLYTPKEKA